MNEFVKTLDESQLMAIQELMVDMSLEERKKFMDQIHSQVNSNNEDRLDADVFYRHGSDVNSFIRESDQRERLDNPLKRQAIPLGPQGEDDASQFEEIFKQMQKQMEGDSKNDSPAEMDEHQGELMRNIMG